MTSSTPTRVVACASASFLLMAKGQSIEWLGHTLFIHSSGDRHPGLFPPLDYYAESCCECSCEVPLQSCLAFGGTARLFLSGCPVYTRPSLVACVVILLVVASPAGEEWSCIPLMADNTLSIFMC